MIIKHGTTRTCILTKKYCFKFPGLFRRKTNKTIKYRGIWYSILLGLLSNIQEREFSGLRLKSMTMNTSSFYIFGGLLIVQPRGKDISDKDWMYLQTIRGNIPDIVEFKRDSFKIVKGKLVAVDFGY